jgi:acyl carrier protein
MPEPTHGPTERRPEPNQSPTAHGATGWWETVREVHRLAAATHASYQRTMADVHLAYLSAVDRSLNQQEDTSTPDRAAPRATATANVAANGVALNGSRSNTPPAAVPVVLPMEPAPMEPPPALADVHHLAVEEPSGPPQHKDNGSADTSSDRAPVSRPAPAEPVTPAVPAARSDSASDDLTALTLQVVADKTGYPVEILRPEMHLQADLGVDSIKRVEVLSALRDRVDGLPALDAAELGRLQTIGEIAERLTSEVGG